MLTIFTPTYNRAHLLPRLHKSLQDQNCYDFEWLIIDDGSTDNTKQVVEEFIQNSKFKIHFQYQENQGKPTATNNALDLLNNSGYFMVIDSDDILKEDAIIIINSKIKRIENDDKIAAIVSPRTNMNSDSLQISNLYEEDLITDPFELSLKYNVQGEFTFIFKNDVIKKYLQPIFKKEKFIKESVVLNRISKYYKYLYIKESLVEAEYQNDGLSADFYNLLKNNPKGAALSFKEQMNNDSYSLANRVQYVKAFWLYENIVGDKNFIQKLNEIESFRLQYYFLKYYILNYVKQLTK